MRNNLVEIFHDTQIKSVKFNDGVTTQHSNNEIVGPYLSVYKGNVKVVNLDTVSALVELSKSGKTCGLNMASYKKPGGGVRNGARAQEECLFRCSNLINSIVEDFYPLEDGTCLYTSDATFFKDKDYNDMEPVECDIITIAAINLNSRSYDKETYEEITLQKIRLMLTIPSKHGVENLVLGAFGCGVFGNDPHVMSELFRKVLVEEGYSSLYKEVVFAVINDHNSVGNNYSVFSDKFYS
jgi:uncharacterized protein (TIGR02452 family)